MPSPLGSGSHTEPPSSRPRREALMCLSHDGECGVGRTNEVQVARLPILAGRLLKNGLERPRARESRGESNGHLYV